MLRISANISVVALLNKPPNDIAQTLTGKYPFIQGHSGFISEAGDCPNSTETSWKVSGGPVENGLSMRIPCYSTLILYNDTLYGLSDS